MDKIVQGNTSNIVYLKSTDDTMIDTLSKMSGVRHKTYIDSKTITRDVQSFLKMTQNDGKASYTATTKEEPVIGYNDFAYISERNSIILRAGDSPIWNRNETILPMSWRLFQNTIIKPGSDFTLQTIPTLSSALEFDVKKNQPDFNKMLAKRMEQAYRADDMIATYKMAYDYDDYQMSQLNDDDLSDDIMAMINMAITNPNNGKSQNPEDDFDDDDLSYEEWEDIQDQLAYDFESDGEVTDNTDVINEVNNRMAVQNDRQMLRYAGGHLSQFDILGNGVTPDAPCNHGLDESIAKIFEDIKGDFEQDHKYFSFRDGSLYSADGTKLYIKALNNEAERQAFNQALIDADKKVYGEDSILEYDVVTGHFGVTNDFLRFLASFETPWPFCNGKFEKAMAREIEEGFN